MYEVFFVVPKTIYWVVRGKSITRMVTSPACLLIITAHSIVLLTQVVNIIRRGMVEFSLNFLQGSGFLGKVGK